MPLMIIMGMTTMMSGRPQQSGFAVAMRRAALSAALE
jgi:hypothetical protein